MAEGNLAERRAFRRRLYQPYQPLGSLRRETQGWLLVRRHCFASRARLLNLPVVSAATDGGRGEKILAARCCAENPSAARQQGGNRGATRATASSSVWCNNVRFENTAALRVYPTVCACCRGGRGIGLETDRETERVTERGCFCVGTMANLANCKNCLQASSLSSLLPLPPPPPMLRFFAREKKPAAA